MTNEQRAERAHEIAARAAGKIIHECVDAGLTCEDLLVACETTIAAVIAAAVMTKQRRDPVRLATEWMEMMTERAQVRVTAVILGVPPPG